MAKRPIAKPKSEVQPDFKVQAIILSRFDVMQYAVGAEEKERRLGLDCLITPVSAADEADENGDSVYYSSACFRCVREGDEERTSVQMVSMYSFAFSCKSNRPEHLELISRNVAATSVWSQFMSVFSLANAQMRARMPLLPPAPNELQQRSTEELGDMFSVFAPSEEADAQPEG